jgi:hypothetical protein
MSLVVETCGPDLLANRSSLLPHINQGRRRTRGRDDRPRYATMDRSSSSSTESGRHNSSSSNNCWRTEPAAPLPRSIFAVDETNQPPPPTPVALVQAHDCYCVCLYYNDGDELNVSSSSSSSNRYYSYYRLAVWRKEDAESVIFLQMIFFSPPLLQIAKAPQEHSCWFVYAIDNRYSHQHQEGQKDRQEQQRHQPQLMAWEITYRSFRSMANTDVNDDAIGAVATASRRFRPSLPPHRTMDIWPAGLWSDKQPREDFNITSLSVFQPDYTPKPMLLMGTANGTVLWSTQISVPMDFTIRKMVDTKTSKPLLDRFKYQPPDTSIVAVIPLLSPTTTTHSNSTTFVVVQSSANRVLGNATIASFSISISTKLIGGRCRCGRGGMALQGQIARVFCQRRR